MDRVLEAFYFLVYWLVASGWRPKKRPSEYWFSLLTLLLGAAAVLIAVYGVVKPPPSAAEVRFDTGVIEGADGGHPKSYAVPRLHEVLRIRLELTPEHQDLGRVVMSVAPPPSVKLTGNCVYEIAGRKRRHCPVIGGEGRIEVEGLGAGETVRVFAEARVVRPIDAREAILVEMTSEAADARQKRIDLYPSGEKERQGRR